MYDKIDLYITDNHLIRRVEASIKSNPAYVRVGNYYEHKYSLKNGKKHANTHGLTVQIIEQTNGDTIAPPMLHIGGSIRKWYYGALSMNDLTRYDTWLVLNHLARELGLSYEELKELPVSTVEVGLNLDIGSMRCEDIKSRIYSFKEARYKSMDTEGYRRFKTNKTSAKIYDKKEEILENINKMKDRLGADRFKNMYKGKNVLRVEFKAHGGANSVGRFLGIQKVGDTVDRYNWVALRWLQYALKFGFKNTELLPFTPVKKSAKEVADYIKCRGLLDIGEVELQSMLSLLPAQARKDARDAIRSLREKMPDAINTRQWFRRLATRQFIQQFNKRYRQYIDAMNTA